MNVALCFAGHMRTYGQTASKWNRHIIKPLNADVFIHTWKRNGPWRPAAQSYSPIADRGSISMDDNFIDVSDIEAKFSPKRLVVEEYPTLEPVFMETAIPVIKWRDECPELYHNYKVTSYISQFYKWYQANQLRVQYEKETGKKYDLVIRTRPDLQIEGELPVLGNLDNTVYAQIGPDPNNLTWVNDILLIGNGKNIDIATNIYPEYLDKLEDAKKKNIPHLFFEIHTILWNQLTTNGIQIQEIALPFSTRNDSLVR